MSLTDEKAFTLIEMLIVLTIITILILLIIPNLTDKNETVHEKGCEALVKTVQAQAGAYQLDEGKAPSSIDDLKNKNYISEEQKKCQNGKSLTIVDGKVRLQNEAN